ncbi:hypothetical protein P175DRAFT_0527305 [Aspergillus ochraceoroseus IBT 24754]|uniref:Uncharacterized protein n=1 Tax=Aspergillus ochraceoroseus IBT 24754 TaxID=1392256 RepID=A0A2T5M5N9_9EURO|nr:uncharacterized protein P175DRAFT_0527305 [Aspergillus ochraceoroseus IBT 24754]PTU23851.1 hypothetical protein P175DRAFT_0527305 [Aspergillus ochraceoroseus IBT 24754]
MSHRRVKSCATWLDSRQADNCTDTELTTANNTITPSLRGLQWCDSLILRSTAFVIRFGIATCFVFMIPTVLGLCASNDLTAWRMMLDFEHPPFSEHYYAWHRGQAQLAKNNLSTLQVSSHLGLLM